MRIAEIIKLLASPFPTQATFLGEIPENAAVDGYTKSNPVYRMAALYLESLSVSEGDGGSEGEASWLSRTEILEKLLANPQHPLWQSLRWLTTAMQMLMALDKDYLFTAHGLRSAQEWKLVRHLAGQVCQTMDWSLTLGYSTFETLWEDVGAGMLDE